MAFDEARDLRSTAHENKRVKDHAHKWARGKRPSPGVRTNFLGDFLTGSKEQQEKFRPDALPNGKHMRSANINKPSTGGHRAHNRAVPSRAWWPKTSTLVELQDPSNMSSSVRELLPSPQGQRKQSVSDDFLYSYDKNDTPGKPVSLGVFVKTNTKATEKFVQKEYEILDYNGESVKGRKALKDLHRGKTAPPVEEEKLVEDEGFELV
ncbi:hypothetical protein F4777DRAFT_232778 [Nemania sp. FL0916]|nr:hypothetical protein F4777DRAFT_232778 [Nemania sp. FL0916]